MVGMRDPHDVPPESPVPPTCSDLAYAVSTHPRTKNIRASYATLLQQMKQEGEQPQAMHVIEDSNVQRDGGGAEKKV
jgi:hypothetical protein